MASERKALVLALAFLAFLCQDGEVESFERLPIQDVLAIIETTDAFKYNCNLVIIDFAIRHGVLTGDNTPEYASLCERRIQLRS